MIFFDNLSKLNKAFIILTIILLLYGYLCRIVGLYFFWESKTIGWTFLFLSTLLVLIKRIRIKKIQDKKSISEKILISLIIFILVIQGIIFFVTPQTNAYKAAKQFLITDKNLSSEVGEVYDFFLIPVGGITVSSSSAGETGGADLNFIVKGKNKFKDINLELDKSLDTEWKVFNTK